MEGFSWRKWQHCAKFTAVGGGEGGAGGRGGVVGLLGVVGWLKQLERTQSAWIGNNDVDDGGGRHLLWS